MCNHFRTQTFTGLAPDKYIKCFSEQKRISFKISILQHWQVHDLKYYIIVGLNNPLSSPHPQPCPPPPAPIFLTILEILKSWFPPLMMSFPPDIRHKISLWWMHFISKFLQYSLFHNYKYFINTYNIYSSSKKLFSATISSPMCPVTCFDSQSVITFPLAVYTMRRHNHLVTTECATLLIIIRQFTTNVKNNQQ